MRIKRAHRDWQWGDIRGLINISGPQIPIPCLVFPTNVHPMYVWRRKEYLENQVFRLHIGDRNMGSCLKKDQPSKKDCLWVSASPLLGTLRKRHTQTSTCSQQAEYQGCPDLPCRINRSRFFQGRRPPILLLDWANSNRDPYKKTPEHCLVNGGVPLVLVEKAMFEMGKMYL